MHHNMAVMMASFMAMMIPRASVCAERIARLIDIAELDRIADADRAVIGLILADNHAKQRGLAGAVGTDHPDNAAGRQLEAQVFHQHAVAVRLHGRRREAAGADNARVNSDRWIEDASYLRIQNLVLGYRIPESLTSRYPNPRTVSSRVGLLGLRSIFCRSQRTCTSTVRVPIGKSYPQTRCRSVLRECTT